MGVIGALLVKALHRRELRHSGGEDGKLVPQRPRDATRGENPVHLLADALLRDLRELGRALPERRLRGRLDRRVQATRKAHRAQHA